MNYLSNSNKLFSNIKRSLCLARMQMKRLFCSEVSSRRHHECPHWKTKKQGHIFTLQEENWTTAATTAQCGSRDTDYLHAGSKVSQQETSPSSLSSFPGCTLGFPSAAENKSRSQNPELSLTAESAPWIQAIYFFFYIVKWGGLMRQTVRLCKVQSTLEKWCNNFAFIKNYTVRDANLWIN